MRRQLGICIELNDNRSVFLLKDGRIVKGLPVGKPVLGEEVLFDLADKKRAIYRQPVMAPLTAALAAVALFVSVLVFPAEEAFGYVQVQINPGIELGINDDYEVVSIRELNSDGQQLIEQLGGWENDSLHVVLDRVFELAVTERTKQITITAVEENDNKTDESIKKVVMAVSSDVKNEQLAIQLKRATKEQWRHSKENQMPVGQLIHKVETLEIQQSPKVNDSNQEKEEMPTKENKAENEHKKQNNTKDINKKEKENKPVVGPKPNSPAVQKKNENQSIRANQQQKTATQNIHPSKSLNKVETRAPIEKQQKIDPVKPVQKEKSTGKNQQKETQKQQQNNRAVEQKKNSSTTIKNKSQSIPNDQKNNEKNPEQSNKDQLYKQKNKDVSPNAEHKPKDKE
ncbi:hypothetical protein AUO94_05370 [Planococcus kocurii]|uniref:RsgI N-terminal anti-sigma domain-containing protein n=1 Tax=Planococcus kocurii TaxID=1374 RepID=A0ABN4JSW7_9BACL|nr:hypothetical protein [Planococcus kocurii]ALS78111.1 hypothetical protein AUO94_05370 [Planococcus kocurii]